MPLGNGTACGDDEVWMLHEMRAGAVVDHVRGRFDPGISLEMERGGAFRELLLSQREDVLGSALMLMVQAVARGQMPPFWGLNDLARRRWTISRDDALLAVRTATDAPDGWETTWALKTAVAMLDRVLADTPLAADERTAVQQMATSVEQRRELPRSDAIQLRTRLLTHLAEAPDEPDTTGIVDADSWARTVLAGLATVPAASVTTLMRHLTIASGSKPSQAWLTRMAEIAQDEKAVAALRVLVAALSTADLVNLAVRDEHVVPRAFLDPRNHEVARAAVWATIPVREPWVVPTLADVALRALSWIPDNGWMFGGERVTNAAIIALGQIATQDAITVLQRVGDSTKHSGIRKRVSAALAVAAESSGSTPDELVDRSRPGGGLDGSGRRDVTVGAVTARLILGHALKVSVEWQTPQGWRSKAPDDAERTDVNVVKQQAKELRDLVTSQRRRLEGLFAADRSWPVDQWRSYYLDHPVTGPLARRLLWIVTEDGGASATGLPSDAGSVRTLTGDAPLPRAGTIRLWHPATAATAEIAAWRDRLMREELVQPFKQAFREVYVVTPAELRTAVYSNRFAAHVVRYQQLYALFRDRGWSANYLGPYESGYFAKARREFPGARLTAVFEHHPAEHEVENLTVGLATTDRVSFMRRSQPVPLADVPPLVFSEAMRDVDLFVSVTSIALEPEWADRGDAPYYEYWSRAASSALTPRGEVRREVLATLLPKLKVADRVELSERYVHVRGRLATYRIHIGSANVMVEDDGRYLCIVPAARPRNVMLPFEGDEVLTVILSKVVLLAADDKITDETILAQLTQR